MDATHRDRRRTMTRRRALTCAIAGTAGGAFALAELIAHGALPGRRLLDEITAACSVPAPRETFSMPGPSYSGRFFSRARGRSIGYTIAYPPSHGPGSTLPLGIVLHGFGGDHASGLGGVSLAVALAARPVGLPHPAPIALVAVDGGGLYWNPHPGDDPMRMIVDELIPMCRRLGLGRARGGIGAIGISMGGYGAILLAERHRELISAVAAISPAVFTSYDQAHAANRGAFASAEDFARDDVITHASALRGLPLRIASGRDDPFHPGVVALGRALPASAHVTIPPGCHDGSFFASQRPPSLAFLAGHIGGRHG